VIPAVGLQLGGRYTLRERIAIGGMGEVWIAWDEHLYRNVVAKVLRAEYVGEQPFLDRLRTEARNTAGISHQNVAAMYDYGEDDGSGYLIMEYVPGEPLSELLARERTLDATQVLPILAQAARGLHAAHRGGVVHRDIKPANLLLTPDGYVKITDFGISLGVNQAPMTAAGMVMGTAQYLPPEQAMGRAATAAGDIYALGVVAYEALVGRRPYTGKTQVDIAFAHVNQPLPPLPEHIDARVRAVVEQMLAKDPEQRPRSAASLARALEELARDLHVAVEPVDTPPEGAPELPISRRVRSGAAEPAASDADSTQQAPGGGLPPEAGDATPKSASRPKTGSTRELRTRPGTGPTTDGPTANSEARADVDGGIVEDFYNPDDEPRWLPLQGRPEPAAGGGAGDGERGDQPADPRRTGAATGAHTDTGSQLRPAAGEGSTSSGRRAARAPQPRPTVLPATRKARRRAAEKAERLSRRRRPGSAGFITTPILAVGLALGVLASTAVLVPMGRLGGACAAAAAAVPLLIALVMAAKSPESEGIGSGR